MCGQSDEPTGWYDAVPETDEPELHYENDRPL